MRLTAPRRSPTFVRPLMSALLASLAIVLVLGCASQPVDDTQLAPAATSNASSPAATPLDGAWELVSSRVHRGDSLLAESRPPQVRSMKVLSGSRFAFLTISGDSTLSQTAAGRFTARDGIYTESIELTPRASRRGQTYTFTYRVENGIWHHQGMVGDLRFDEEWRRAEQ